MPDEPLGDPLAADALARDLLAKHHVLTLATIDPATQTPYATPLFYAPYPPFDATTPLGPAALVMVSDEATAHARHVGRGPLSVAAAVYLEAEPPADLEGLQLTGDLVREDALGLEEARRARAAYLARHKVARPHLEARPGVRVYVLVLRAIKVTHSRLLGFGVHALVRPQPLTIDADGALRPGTAGPFTGTLES